MSEAKFTPGPWVAKFADDWKHWVVTANSMPLHTPVVRLSDFDDSAGPDAHLIAAAPDLYTALERIVESVARGTSGDVCQTFDFDDARLALSKARGETT